MEGFYHIFKSTGASLKTSVLSAFVCFIWARPLLAQEGFPLYSEYINGNPYVAHPSMAGNRLTGFRLISSLRGQWLNQPNAPKLLLFTSEYSFSSRSKVGLQLFSDQNGYHIRKGTYITYAHHISFQDAVWNTKRAFTTRNDKLKELYFGLSIGNLQNRFNTEFYDLNTNDPLVGTAGQNISFFNVDAGFSFLTTQWFIHLTIKNLLKSPFQTTSSISPQEVATLAFRRLLVGVGYTYYAKTDWSIQSSVLFQTAEITNEKIVDLNLKLYRYIRTNRVWIGVSYRKDFNGLRTNTEDVGEKISMEWFTPLVGINYKQFSFSYNYAQMTHQPNFTSTGIHQLSFGISF